MALKPSGGLIIGRRKVNLTPSEQLVKEIIRTLAEQDFSIFENAITKTETGAVIPVEKDGEQYIVQVSITKTL